MEHDLVSAAGGILIGKTVRKNSIPSSKKKATTFFPIRYEPRH